MLNSEATGEDKDGMETSEDTDLSLVESEATSVETGQQEEAITQSSDTAASTSISSPSEDETASAAEQAKPTIMEVEDEASSPTSAQCPTEQEVEVETLAEQDTTSGESVLGSIEAMEQKDPEPTFISEQPDEAASTELSAATLPESDSASLVNTDSNEEAHSTESTTAPNPPEESEQESNNEWDASDVDEPSEISTTHTEDTEPNTSEVSAHRGWIPPRIPPIHPSCAADVACAGTNLFGRRLSAHAHGHFIIAFVTNPIVCTAIPTTPLEATHEATYPS